MASSLPLHTHPSAPTAPPPPSPDADAPEAPILSLYLVPALSHRPRPLLLAGRQLLPAARPDAPLLLTGRHCRPTPGLMGTTRRRIREKRSAACAWTPRRASGACLLPLPSRDLGNQGGSCSGGGARRLVEEAAHGWQFRRGACIASMEVSSPRKAAAGAEEHAREAAQTAAAQGLGREGDSGLGREGKPMPPGPIPRFQALPAAVRIESRLRSAGFQPRTAERCSPSTWTSRRPISTPDTSIATS
jgi:hypothetical protein